MQLQTQQNYELIKIAESKEFLNRVKNALGEQKAGKFQTALIQLFLQNELLHECDANSIINAALQATSLGFDLNPSLGHCYIVPYNTKKGNLAQFQIGYIGFKQLAISSGMYEIINASEIREGEIVTIDPISAIYEFKALPYNERKQRKIVGYYSFFKMHNGFRSGLYMSIEEMQEHATNYSKTYKKGFGNWVNDFNSMALKTVLKLNLRKNGYHCTPEISRALESDQAVIESFEDAKFEYVDNEQKPTKEEQKKEIELNSIDKRVIAQIERSTNLDELAKVKNYLNENTTPLYTQKLTLLTQQIQNNANNG